MRRATTPTHRFALQFPVETIKRIRYKRGYAEGEAAGYDKGKTESIV